MACKGGTLSDGKDKFYPNAFYEVGDLFLTTRNENPSIRFGGTWELFGKGKTLVCVDTSDSDFSTVKKIGGEKTHTLTVDEMPSHSHKLRAHENAEGFGDGYLASSNSYYYNLSTSVIENAGGGQAHNNMPPYITCYIWIRIK